MPEKYLLQMKRAETYLKRSGEREIHRWWICILKEFFLAALL
jgi:hypothetical protein